MLLPRADIAGPDLADNLCELGAQVQEVVAYRTVAENFDKGKIEQALKKGEIDWITFTSSSTVRYFLERIEIEQLPLKRVRIASIGPVTSATIKEARLPVEVEATEHTIAGLVAAMCRAGR